MDLSAHIARAQARAGAAAHRPPPVEVMPPAGPVHPDDAEALVRSVLGVREVSHWEDHGGLGWVCRETGEVQVLTPTG